MNVYAYKYPTSREKIRRNINRIFRNINESIYNDNLWKGRFVIVQDRMMYRQYEDKSGYCLYIWYHMYDKRTGAVKHYLEDSVRIQMFNGSLIHMQMNDFITGWCEAWNHEDPRSVNDDYRNVKFERKQDNDDRKPRYRVCSTD